VDEIKEQWAMDRTFTSKISTDKRKGLIQEWKKAVSRARSWENS
jgi:glycerol kinase